MKLKSRLHDGIKIIRNLMAGFDIEELASIKNGYQGNKFQWIKTNDKLKLGTVVTVHDVIPGKRMNTVNGPVQQYVAVLSDGSRIDTEMLNSNLMMLLDDQPPLTMTEVMSINIDAGLNVEEIKSALPPDMQALSNLQEKPKTGPVVNQGVPGPDDSGFGPGRNVRPVDTKDLFGMFSLEDTNMTLSVSVKLPAKSLLKMMYANSQDKEEFIEKLSAHINNSITQDAIKASVKKFMGHEKNKKEDER